jgi:hypothetical protein
MSGSMNWRERYRLYEEKAFDASRIETTPERAAAFDECQKMFEDLMSDPDRPISESDSLQITSIEQLLAWCDRAQTDELFPFHIRQVRDAAEKLGIRVKLPVLPIEAEFLNGRNQELMDRWKNIVTEFIESIERSLEKLCTDDPILDNEVEPEANLPSLTLVEQAIIEICDGRKLKNHEIMSELAADGLIIEIRSLKTTVQRLIELGKLHRPDGVDSRKGVTKKT